MPLITIPLQALGPIVNALVGASFPRIQALAAQGLALPAPVNGNFLIDTGASATCVDAGLIAGLNLPLIGRVMMATPSTGAAPVACDQYDASLIIPGNTPDGTLVRTALPIIAVHLAPQGIQGLIGRDVINGCMLTYHGPAGMITLAH